MPVIRPRRDRRVDVRAHCTRVSGVLIYRYDVLSGGPCWLGLSEWVAIRKLVHHHRLGAPAARQELRNARIKLGSERDGVWIG